MPMTGGAMADVELDTRGLNCPLPILRLKKALNGMTSGQVLRMQATDPGAVRDVEAFCRQTRHRLLSATEAGGIYSFEVQKS